MKVIGLCGGSGAGKGTVCDLFKEIGIRSIDTDKVYHSMISTDSECTKELVSVFGNTIYAHPGIDRAALREIVFKSQNNLKKLNEITHKHILSEVREFIKASSDCEAVIIDAPLLFESGFDKECDVTVCVIADSDVRIARIMKRDNISSDVANARISSQISNDLLVQMCDHSIDNSSTVSALRKKVYELKNKLFDN